MNRKLKAIGAVLLCTLFLISAFAVVSPVSAKETSRAPVNKAVFGELFTATWCQFCVKATNSLSTVINDTNYYPNRFVLMEWHGSDEYAIAEVSARATMYGVTGYPTTVMDGDAAGKLVGGQEVSTYKSAIDSKPTTTAVTINITNVTLASNLLAADIEYQKVDTMSPAQPRARIFVVEDLKKTFSNSGGIGYMRHTVRDDVYDASLDLSDNQPHKISLSGISAPSSWDKYAIGVVAIYQDNSTKNVLQSKIWEFHNYPVPIVKTPGSLDFSMNEDVVDEHIDATTIFGTDPEAQTVTYKLKSKAVPSHLPLAMNGTKVKITPEANWFGQETITIEADDGYAKNDPSIFEVVVTVASVNDPPTVLTPIADVKMKEGSSKTINLLDPGKEVFIDVEGDALTFTATDLETTPHMTVSILKGAAPAVKIDVPDLSAGKDTIQVTANDGKDSTSITFKVEITDVNHAPIVKTKMGTVTFDEDTVYDKINLQNVFFDADGDTLAFEFWGNTKIAVATNPAGNVTLTPAKDWSGTETITFRATDTGALNCIDELTATVNPVNDAPVIKTQLDPIEMKEDETYETEDPLTAVFTDVETPSESLVFEVDGPEALHITVQDDYNLMFEPDANYFETGEFTITASDGELSTDMIVEFTVESVNDPVIIDPANVKPTSPTPSVDEGKEVTFEAPATDADTGTTLKYTWTVGEEVQEDETSSTFTYAPDKTMGGKKVTVSVTVSDDTGSEATFEWTVNVKDINNKPTLTLVSPEAGKEYPAGALDLKATGEDIDGDVLKFTWYVDNAPIGEGTNQTYDFKTSGPHTVKVKVSDGKLEETKEVSITIKGSSGGGSGGKGGAPGFELVALVAAIGVAAIVVMRRRE